MKKMPSLFVRDWNGDPSLVTREVDPACDWVIRGEGKATRKWDGTAVLVRDGRLFARFDAKYGKLPPTGFEPCGDADPKTGHHPGWVPADRPEDKWIREAFENEKKYQDFSDFKYSNGTYEACGPKIGGNPDGFETHRLVLHGLYVMNWCPRSFDAIKEWLSTQQIEGVVWHHEDGRMCKIKRTDFGLEWGSKKKRVCITHENEVK